MNRDEKAIRDTIKAWLKASMGDDLATLMSVLDDRMLFIVPNAKPFGKREFAAEGQGKPCRIKASAKVLEVEVHGKCAWTRCHVDVRITPRKGSPDMRMAGPTLTVWKKKGGRWLIYRDGNFVVPVK